MPEQIYGAPAVPLVLGLVAIIISLVGWLKGKRRLPPELGGAVAFVIAFVIAWYYLWSQGMQWDEAAFKAAWFGLGIPLVHKILVKPFTDGVG